MLKKALLALAVLAALLAGFAIFVATRPSDFRVQRSATIAAPAAVVFEQVNDFHNWDAWSPWAKLDPAAKNTFEGAPAGAGAVFAWSGNDKIGAGRMTLTESKPNELVRIKLDFIKPFEATCTTEFAFRGEGEQTAVTWTMAGHNNFIAKAMCLFMDMDANVGGDFERGLANIKAVAEAKTTK